MRIAQPISKKSVRLGLIQQMRSLSNLNALFEQFEFLLMLFLAMNVILHYFLSFSQHP
jgi:hypothetical protein